MKNKDTIGINSERLILLLIIIVSFISNYWIISPRNGFIFDDYSWLNTVKFNSYSDIFNFIPQSKYNDRSVGTIFIKLLFDSFGMDFIKHHVWLLLLHMINTILLFSFIKKVLKEINYNNAKFLPLIVVVIFGIFPRSLMAVQWDAAIFDLLGATLILLVLNIYVLRNLMVQYKVFHTIIIVVLYYLALRTKEMALTLPVILFIYETIKISILNNLSLKTILSSIKNNKLLIVLCFIMISYFLLLNHLPSAGNMTEDVTSPYYLSFNPIDIFKSLLKYLILYLNYTIPDFTFTKFNKLTITLLVFYIISFVISVYYLVKKKNYILILVFLAIAAAFSPVLPMKNMQHILYLYIPSIFLSIFFAIFLNFIVSVIKPVSFKISFILVLILSGYLLTFSEGISNFKEYWLSVSDNNRISITQLYQIKKPEKGATIYIENVKDSHNVFYYGPGFVNNIIFNDPTIKTELNPKSINKQKSYLLLDYDNGSLREIERREINQEMIIEETYPNKIIAGVSFNKQPNGDSALAVKGINISAGTKIIANDIVLETIISNDNIATVIIPNKMFEIKGVIKIQLKNNNLTSKEKLITVE
ncbi:hypothetical protein GC098_21210 [Paenibacillus sp. LMG 31458]|uniref:Glycosyltransferase RgtA/B/C/D-like domain-containing protein n=1 Tax=Paenibacillus phytorum TaxID=2654977 RepID=A0ABX1XZB1_9BACL|nr:hypothetical protein [Paenibacillus phytorum]NOU73886.1 hypothetical protein [Paenibacillus phytorum]